MEETREKREYILFLPLILVIIGLFAVITGHSQTVTVDQSFLDSSTKAFTEVVADRQLIQAQKGEISALELLNIAVASLDLSKDNEIKALNSRDEARLALIGSQEQQIKALAAIKCDTTTILFIIKKKHCR